VRHGFCGGKRHNKKTAGFLQQVRHQIAQLGSKVKQQVRLKVKQQVKTTVSAKTTFGTAKKKT
jgi:hypothetical protein